MKCQVCGSESGKHVLCRDCNALRMYGLIIKCPICNQWHHKDTPCMQSNAIPIAEPRPQPLQTATNEKFLYKPKRSLMSRMEQDFYLAIVARFMPSADTSRKSVPQKSPILQHNSTTPRI